MTPAQLAADLGLDPADPIVLDTCTILAKKLTKRDPWSDMAGRWPRMDSVGPDKLTHWNDGHYGLLCFTKQPTGLFRQEFLRLYLPGWHITDDRIPGQTAYRTTNSRWTP